MVEIALRLIDSSPRNAFEYLEIIYIETRVISAADSLGLSLLLFTQLFLKVKRS